MTSAWKTQLHKGDMLTQEDQSSTAKTAAIILGWHLAAQSKNISQFENIAKYLQNIWNSLDGMKLIISWFCLSEEQYKPV